MDHNHKTIESYDKCAERFVKKYFDLGLFKDSVQHFSNLLKEESSILDLGCGPGNVAKFLMDQGKGYKILGVDLSTEMLKLAHQNAPCAEYLRADIRDLKLKRKFDAVIASFCMIHLEDDEAIGLLRKTHELLNDQGYLYLSFMSGGIPGPDKASFSEEEMFFNYFSPVKIEKELLNLGYRIIARDFHEYLGNKDQLIQDVILIVNKQQITIRRKN